MKIAIVGLAGSGKDTFGELLLKHLDDSWEIAKYAQPLKELTRSIFGDKFDDRSVKNIPVVLSDDYGIKEIYVKLQSEVRSFIHNNVADFHTRNKAYRRWQALLDTFDSISPRMFQQLFGTEVMRSLDTNFWVDKLKSKEGNFIITDARFNNEIEGMDYLFLVVRPSQDLKHLHFEHASEAMAKTLTLEASVGLIDLEYMILQNNGTIDDLEHEAKWYAKLIKNLTK